MDEAQALHLLDALLRMAEALLSCGAPAADVTAVTLRAASGCGLRHCHLDITYTSVTISAARRGRPPLTTLRVVQVRGIDYSRLAALYALAHEAAAGVRADDLAARLRAVLDVQPRAPRTVASLGTATLAAAVAFLIGGGWAVAVAAALTTGLIDLLLQQANRHGLPAFFQQVAGAALATAVALGLTLLEPVLPSWLGPLPPSMVVGAGIVVLLAGLSLVGSAEDAISGYYVTASARVFETLLMTTGLVLGIAGVLDVAQRAGLRLTLVPAAVGGLPPLVEAATAGIAALAWAVVGRATRWAVLMAGLAGALGWLVFDATTAAGLGPTAASAVAALAVGFVAESTAWRWGVPGPVVSVCGIVPLLPGLAIYSAIFSVVEGSGAQGLTQLVGALGTGLALAAGVTLGEFCSTPLRREFDRVEQRVRRRALSRRG